MDSIARYHFPVITWRGDQKYLWNPIHRKALKNRPEERVRLRIIEYLMGAGWSKHRITTEEAIKDYADAGLRTDIICYTRSFEPQILVECKAENVPLSAKTAEQVARYNRQVQAPYLLMSNGLQDFWYHINPGGQTVKPLEALPGFFDVSIFHSKRNSASNPDSDSGSVSKTGLLHDFDYWKNRGFAGAKAGPPVRKWLEPVLNQFSAPLSTSQLRYLHFKKSPPDLDLNHYYVITRFEKHDEKIALSFMSSPYGGSRMVGILNRNGKNAGVAEINLDLVFKDEQPNTSLYSADGVETVDFRRTTRELFDDNTAPDLNELSSSLRSLFEQ